MESVTEISKFIFEKLKPIDPYKVILFGSYAYGNPGKDSDIDLMVVTNDNKLPADYNESFEIHLKVSKLLSDLKENYPVDLIVYTKPMFELFVKMDSMFSKEIIQKGILIYESNNTAVA